MITFYDAGRETAVCGHWSTVTDHSQENAAFWAEREAVRYIGVFRGRPRSSSHGAPDPPCHSPTFAHQPAREGATADERGRRHRHSALRVRLEFDLPWPLGVACPRAPTRHRAGGAPRARAVRRARPRSPCPRSAGHHRARHGSARHRGARRSGSVPRWAEPARGHGGSSRCRARRLTAAHNHCHRHPPLPAPIRRRQRFAKRRQMRLPQQPTDAVDNFADCLWMLTSNARSVWPS